MRTPLHDRRARNASAAAASLGLLLLTAVPASASCPASDHDCFTTGGPGCTDVDCCEQVCAVDPFCCDVAWDGLCVKQANQICYGGGVCPPSDHDCFTTGGPGCTDLDCCETVCAFDSFCCQVAWDGLCVNGAFQACGQPECPFECSAGATPEGEPCGADTNGGCNSLPPIFGSISCGEAICGDAWAAAGVRDTDWYEITITGPTEVAFSISNIVPMVIGIVDTGGVPDCGLASTLLPVEVAPFCGSASFTTCIRKPGTYWFFAAPNAFDGFPCGAENDYEIALSCTPLASCACVESDHDCFTSGAPGCDDRACCELVCAFDGFCCTEGWDLVCVQWAIKFCTPDCAPPPTGMTAWWSFDALDIDGLNRHRDVTPNGNHGLPGALAPAVPGMVKEAGAFNGVSTGFYAPGSSSLSTSCGGLSADLWLRREPPGVDGNVVNLVSRYDVPGGGGWVFALDPIAGTLELVLESELGTCCPVRCAHSSTGTVPIGAWTHVAFTLSPCCGGGQRTVTFYINGQPAGSDPVGCCDLTSVPGPAPVTIGAPVWVADGWYHGLIDEVELFCRAIAPDDIAAIHAARQTGKCREWCKTTWDTLIDLSDVFASGPITASLYHNLATPQTYSIAVAESLGCALPPGSLVTGITYQAIPSTVVVPPNTIVDVPISFDLSGASGLGEACFTVTVTNQSTGRSCSSIGLVSLVGSPPWWVEASLPGVALLPDGSAEGSFRLTAGAAGATIDFEIAALPSDMLSLDSPISLNGLPAGETIVGSMRLGPGATAELAVTLALDACGGSLAWYDVIFFGELIDGLGPRGLASFGVRSVAPPELVGDLNGDGLIDGSDLGILLSQWGACGGCAGDLNGDGVVDGSDLGITLAGWGAPAP